MFNIIQGKCFCRNNFEEPRTCIRRNDTIERRRFPYCCMWKRIPVPYSFNHMITWKRIPVRYYLYPYDGNVFQYRIPWPLWSRGLLFQYRISFTHMMETYSSTAFLDPYDHVDTCTYSSTVFPLPIWWKRIPVPLYVETCSRTVYPYRIPWALVFILPYCYWLPMSIMDKILNSFIHAYLYDYQERKRIMEGNYTKYTSNYSVFVQILFQEFFFTEWYIIQY
jgi:hypothetical protein